MDKKGHAVVVLIESPAGIPLVRDPKKPAPIYWKIPGGRSIGEETAVEVGQREIKEELGLNLSLGQLSLLYSEDRGNHTFTLFGAKTTSMAELKSRGDEGEEITLVNHQQIAGMEDFFPPHQRILQKLGLI